MQNEIETRNEIKLNRNWIETKTKNVIAEKTNTETIFLERERTESQKQSIINACASPPLKGG